MSKIKFFFQQSWLLIFASLIFGLLLAVTNAALQDKIEQNEQNKLNKKMAELITDANSFELVLDDVVIQLSKSKTVKTDIYRSIDSAGRTIGFAYIAEGPGFADKIKLVIAADAKLTKFYGFKVLASSETPGFGDKIKDEFYNSQYTGAPFGKLELVKIGDDKKIDSEIVAISGATVSSEAVIKIFNSYTNKVLEKLEAEGLTGNDK
ncbi:Na(+)-translocating ferredoxin:NAD(+) oxidoreductase complex subunit G [subsurface metagenome]